MGQPQLSSARALLGVTVTGLWQLATVSADGTIPLPGTLVLESPAGFVTFSCAQEGLSCRGLVPREEIRWNTEPDLAMDSRGDEEWLSLVPLEAANLNLVLTEQRL
ncbi:hypothetical protein SAMN05192558_10928 [Actinokineospora alba]|uniref:Uncharacterized protein n=1 Tax=Actinokineospora alba TaxID=504798 RepID=A0A1H0SQU5_9PSEU|nr:hypothetical protein [Actinokineospora alba]TDP66604.1 hypothetical protein C8E96_2116 [Actinokineospora alba]SDJ38746.1 hypothetical protein SAMN05421871_114118 [Actinokineospora alba]SDP43608.1 hypothetical protein SAMN05192558_10928 [Actinokineospora alba]